MTGDVGALANTPADRSSVFGFLTGGGELGALMRAHDWPLTPFGPVETWPQSLRSAVSICLGTTFPIAIYWGPQLALLYNDAWSPIPGAKHPWALGRPGRDVWPEIWDAIGPLFARVQETGEGVWQQDQLLAMRRHGYTEECYFNFTFSPIRGEDGGVGGIFNAVVETTFRVIGERRERTLRLLAERLAAARSEVEVCTIAAEALHAQPADVPFCLLYVMTESGTARLVASAGLAEGGAACPALIDPSDTGAPWPLGHVLETEQPQVIEALSEKFGVTLSGGAWPEPSESAVVLPIAATARPGALAGFLISGISPRRAFDEEYQAFLERAAAHVAATLANVHAYEEERRRAEALAEINRAKTTFFSNVSHEFRTPLTLMLGPLEEALAADPETLTGRRDDLAVVHRNGLRLLKLVNALLDFSRIEAGRAQAAFEPTDLATFTAGLASNFRSACERAGLSLVLDCVALPEPVHVDRDMWEKIVLNLLSNAFKFTFDGAITVELRPTGGAAELTVRDTGTGIPAHEMPRLFERFHRVQGARGRSYEGSGIGLALVQELVRLHGGDIRVESEEGRGTAFFVRIPFGTSHLPPDHIRSDGTRASTAVRAQAYVEEALRWLPGAANVVDDLSPAPVVDPAAVGDGTRARVLLADDNADMREYVCRLLGGRHEVEAVPDGEAALTALRERRPDLLLTDAMMPRLDGFGLLQAIRTDPDLNDLPVIMLSARAGEEASIEGRAAGADDYLVKPFSARELIARIDTALAMARLRREHTEVLRRLNEVLAVQVEERTRERDRVWSISRDLFVVCGMDGLYRTVNPAWTDQLGHAEEELVGMRFDGLVHPADLGTARTAFERLAGGDVIRDFDIRVRARDGGYRWYTWTAVPEGEVFYAAGRDVTARKELEEQLRQAHKMEAVGKLTGGVAHDFNNLLQVIGGNLQLLAKDVAGNERAEKRLRNALSGVGRGSKLASHLLAFGRRQPLAPRVINLGRLVRGIDDMLRRALGEAVEIETMIAGGLWNTFVDAA
ncbi:ATP-binding protein, partial [Arenibaculum pallidiluteum]|uniref:ATP-binding protein n=1 Tax=Arenibaculum pallidiluteum TaxID=2812559 RepID=UPI001A96BC35